MIYETCAYTDTRHIMVPDAGGHCQFNRFDSSTCGFAGTVRRKRRTMIEICTLSAASDVVDTIMYEVFAGDRSSERET